MKTWNIPMHLSSTCDYMFVWISFETSVTSFSETTISDGESLFGLEKKKFPAKKIFHFPPNSQ